MSQQEKFRSRREFLFGVAAATTDAAFATGSGVLGTVCACVSKNEVANNKPTIASRTIGVLSLVGSGMLFTSASVLALRTKKRVDDMRNRR